MKNVSSLIDKPQITVGVINNRIFTGEMNGASSAGGERFGDNLVWRLPWLRQSNPSGTAFRVGVPSNDISLTRSFSTHIAGRVADMPGESFGVLGGILSLEGDSLENPYPIEVSIGGFQHNDASTADYVEGLGLTNFPTAVVGYSFSDTVASSNLENGGAIGEYGNQNLPETITALKAVRVDYVDFVNENNFVINRFNPDNHSASSAPKWAYVGAVVYNSSNSSEDIDFNLTICARVCDAPLEHFDPIR